ncbi:hypothetical protein PRIPAC_95373 [Pristionchus pacificus]|uniref:Arf-GAP domain-containing protein n=1 Tax=Pristionchus pacificus TaxID=54126 RepID=A0A2A6D2I2_PRIPA|nr:hypothetical protein PRIPAC_95373 [Pristionchus pacificus]|eukprot:PDM84682.1 hypothetical protein PRIPAC_33705 [Pristionchus pacificus]
MPPKSKVDPKKAEADRLQGLVLALLREEENKYCADCDGKQPRWASWNLGVFICIRCAGIHRNLGVHVSKVKSVNLDSWTAEQCQSMRVMGNAKAKVVYEADLPEHFRRPQTDQQLESFIRAKYEHKRYILRDWVAPRVDVSEIPPAGEESRASNPSAVSSIKPPVGARVTNRPAEVAGNELLDISFPAATQPKATPTPSLLDFDSSGDSVTAPTANNGALTGDIDDIFGSFVSAGPTATNTSCPPSDPAPSAASIELSGITGDLSALSMGSNAFDDKKSNSDILALFGNVPKAVPTSHATPGQQPQHNWGGGLFGGPAAPAYQQKQVNGGMSGLNFNSSFGMQPTQPPVQPTMSGGMGDLSGLLMGGNAMNAQPPKPELPHQQMMSMHQPPQTSAFDSLSLNSLFPGGLSQASFTNPQTAAAFAAASPFASPPSMMGGENGLNFDSLL